MLALHKNPQARRAMLWLNVFAVSALSILLIGHHLLHELHTKKLIQQAADLFGIHLTQGDLRAYLQNGVISHSAQHQSNQLLAQQFVPKQLHSDYIRHIIILICVWVIFYIVARIIISLYLKRFFAKISTLNDYVLNLHSLEEPLDIRQSKEGLFSQLEHSLYQTAKTLHTQYQLSKGHKDYLDANIANISHQLKTPLTALWVVNDLMLDLPINERTDEKLLQLEPQLQRIDALIQSLLLLTRLDAHAITFKKEKVSLRELIARIHEQFNTLLAPKNLSFTTVGPTDIAVLADSFYLQEALFNIIKNAIDHSFNDSTITLYIDDNVFYTSITIENSGPQIDKDDLPYIFKRFYKGKNATPTSIGIGLSLAHDILDQHSGKLSAQNIDTGVRFILTLPKN